MSALSDYKMPPGHETWHPEIYVHDSVIDHLGGNNIGVNYDRQAWLHQEELPILIPTTPKKMPVVYIDGVVPEKPTLELEPRRKLSRDSYREGDHIHINLRTFSFDGEQAVTSATGARLAREIVLQSAARAVHRRDRVRLDKREVYYSTRLAVFGGLLAGFGAQLLFNEPEFDVGAALLVGGGIAIPNYDELFAYRRDRLKKPVLKVVETLARRHRDDFTIPGSIG